MSDKFTVESFVARAMAANWSWRQAAEELAKFVPGLDVEQAQGTMLGEAYEYEARQLAEHKRLGTKPTPEGEAAIAREAACWGVQAAIDDAVPPTVRDGAEPTYRAIGATWTAPTELEPNRAAPRKRAGPVKKRAGQSRHCLP